MVGRVESRPFRRKARLIASTSAFHRLARIEFHVLAGRHDAAPCADRRDAVPATPRAYAESAEYRFYAALAHAGAHDSSPDEQRKTHLDSLRHHHRELTIRSALNPANFGARASLLAAEIARIEGRELQAEQLFEEAIRQARETGFVQIEAIAAECAARFYEARGLRTAVLAYLTTART